MLVLDSHAILIGQAEHVALGEQRNAHVYAEGTFMTTQSLDASHGHSP
jgi:hypothetical protein